MAEREMWVKEIERAAREQAAAQILVLGAPIAWAYTAKVGNATDGFSSVHTVGASDDRGQPQTTCGEPIPAPCLWVALSPALVRTMAHCGLCDAGVRQLGRGKAA